MKKLAFLFSFCIVASHGRSLGQEQQQIREGRSFNGGWPEHVFLLVNEYFPIPEPTYETRLKIAETLEKMTEDFSDFSIDDIGIDGLKTFAGNLPDGLTVSDTVNATAGGLNAVADGLRKIATEIPDYLTVAGGINSIPEHLIPEGEKYETIKEQVFDLGGTLAEFSDFGPHWQKFQIFQILFSLKPPYDLETRLKISDTLWNIKEDFSDFSIEDIGFDGLKKLARNIPDDLSVVDAIQGVAEGFNFIADVLERLAKEIPDDLTMTDAVMAINEDFNKQEVTDKQEVIYESLKEQVFQLGSTLAELAGVY